MGGFLDANQKLDFYNQVQRNQAKPYEVEESDASFLALAFAAVSTDGGA